VKAADGRCEVYLDGGIRQGTDVFKAIALGAKMVFMGRPALWGLACSGEDGVKSILTIMKTELDSVMALTGKYFSFLLQPVLFSVPFIFPFLFSRLCICKRYHKGDGCS